MRVKPETEKTPTQPEAPAEEEAAPVATASPGGMTLAQRMALPEPRRTAELEKAVESGEQFYLRSRTGKKLKQTYGRHVLELTKEPKGFSAAHAIHLLWYLGEQVEEVSEV